MGRSFSGILLAAMLLGAFAGEAPPAAAKSGGSHMVTPILGAPYDPASSTSIANTPYLDVIPQAHIKSGEGGTEVEAYYVDTAKSLVEAQGLSISAEAKKGIFEAQGAFASAQELSEDKHSVTFILGGYKRKDFFLDQGYSYPFKHEASKAREYIVHHLLKGETQKAKDHYDLWEGIIGPALVNRITRTFSAGIEFTFYFESKAHMESVAGTAEFKYGANKARVQFDKMMKAVGTKVSASYKVRVSSPDVRVSIRADVLRGLAGPPRNVGLGLSEALRQFLPNKLKPAAEIVLPSSFGDPVKLLKSAESSLESCFNNVIWSSVPITDYDLTTLATALGGKNDWASLNPDEIRPGPAWLELAALEMGELKQDFRAVLRIAFDQDLKGSNNKKLKQLAMDARVYATDYANTVDQIPVVVRDVISKPPAKGKPYPAVPSVAKEKQIDWSKFSSLTGAKFVAWRTHCSAGIHKTSASTYVTGAYVAPVFELTVPGMVREVEFFSFATAEDRKAFKNPTILSRAKGEALGEPLENGNFAPVWNIHSGLFDVTSADLATAQRAAIDRLNSQIKAGGPRYYLLVMILQDGSKVHADIGSGSPTASLEGAKCN